jgi:hypothetical protein
MISFFSRWSERQRRRYEVAIAVRQGALKLRRERPPLVQRVELDEIQRVVMYKRDEWTTDLVCCEVWLSAAEDDVTLHEEMAGFDNAMSLLETLPGFRKDWREDVIQPPFAPNVTVVFERLGSASTRTERASGLQLRPTPAESAEDVAVREG